MTRTLISYESCSSDYFDVFRDQMCLTKHKSRILTFSGNTIITKLILSTPQFFFLIMELALTLKKKNIKKQLSILQL